MAFLVEGLVARRHQGGDLDLGALFQEMFTKYIARHTSRGDRPCFFARLGPDQAYNTEEPDMTPAIIPVGRILARDVLGLS